MSPSHRAARGEDASDSASDAKGVAPARGGLLCPRVTPPRAFPSPCGRRCSAMLFSDADARLQRLINTPPVAVPRPDDILHLAPGDIRCRGEGTRVRGIGVGAAVPCRC